MTSNATIIMVAKTGLSTAIWVSFIVRAAVRPGVPCEAVLRAEGPDAGWRWRSFSALWKIGKIED